MASAETVYNVVTRFTTEERGAVAGANRVTNALGTVDRQANRTKRTLLTGFATGGLQKLGLQLTAAGGGLAVMASLVMSVKKTFDNLNQAQNTALALGSQFNLAFKFTEDPAANMVASLDLGRKFMADMARDAARLPGELADFQRAMSVTGLPILASGGDLATVRKTLANLSIVAPMAGQGMEEGGRQLMRMLTGQATVGDNPMFAMLTAAGLLPGAAKFNKLEKPEKLRLVTEAFAKLSENPIFRERLIHTFDVQLGTLKDNLFGINGILGQLGAGPFDGLITGLEKLNAGLAEKTPMIVSSVQTFMSELAKLLDYLPKNFAEKMANGDTGWKDDLRVAPGGAGLMTIWNAVTDPRARAMAQTLYSNYPDPTTRKGVGPYDYVLDQLMREDAEQRSIDPTSAAAGAAEGFVAKMLAGQPKPTPRPGFGTGTGEDGKTKHVVQHITIKMDIKTDASPEGIVLPLKRKLKQLATFPTQPARHPKMVPGPSSVHP